MATSILFLPYKLNRPTMRHTFPCEFTGVCDSLLVDDIILRLDHDDHTEHGGCACKHHTHNPE